MFAICTKKTGEAESFLLQLKQQKANAFSLVKITLPNNALVDELSGRNDRPAWAGLSKERAFYACSILLSRDCNDILPETGHSVSGVLSASLNACSTSSTTSSGLASGSISSS